MTTRVERFVGEKRIPQGVVGRVVAIRDGGFDVLVTGFGVVRGRIETNVNLLLDEHGFGAARALVEAKRRGERSELSPDLAEEWKATIGRAFDVLDASVSKSVRPEEPPNVQELDAWLVALRRRL